MWRDSEAESTKKDPDSTLSLSLIWKFSNGKCSWLQMEPQLGAYITHNTTWLLIIGSGRLLYASSG